jgi:hypothetical protein
MPFYKTTKNILIDHGEYFEQKWMDSNEIFIPKSKEWDYKRNLTVDDVDLWEVIYEGIIGVYASYIPHAEFYMIRLGWNDKVPKIECYYGIKAGEKTFNRCKELGVDLIKRPYYVSDDQLWLY